MTDTLFDRGPAPEDRPSSDEFQYKFIGDFTQGLNVSERSDAIRDGNLLTADNVRFEKMRVVTDNGFKAFGQVVRGNPRREFNFVNKNGVAILVLITNLTFYKYNAATNVTEWQYVSDGTSTTLSSGASATDVIISVVDASSFSANDFIGLALDNGKQHQTTIASIATNDITIDDAVPSAAASGKELVKAVVLAGNVDIGVSVVNYPGVDEMYFTNGADTPKKYDGSTCIDILNLPGSTFIAKLVAIFNNHILLMHTTEDGTAFPQRVRRSDTGDPTEWVTGNAGFNDLLDNSDFIVATEELGAYQIVYKERSTVRIEWINQVGRLFDFKTTLNEDGALSALSVAKLSDRHIVFGNRSVFEYDGGFDLNVIDDDIREKLYGVDREIASANVSRSFAFYVEEFDEAWFFYPSSNSAKPDRMVRVKGVVEGKPRWASRLYSKEFEGFGLSVVGVSKTWNDLVGDWTQQTGSWISGGGEVDSPTIMLCGSNPTLQVYEYDFIQVQDDGTDIAVLVETKDFYVPNRLLRFDRFEYSVKGTNVKLSYSTDRGLTWILLKTSSPGSSYARQRVFKQFVVRRVRFKFEAAVAGFGLEWLGFLWKRESIW